MENKIRWPWNHCLYLYPFLKKINQKDVFFIHIPKTGGTSINHALEMGNPKRRLGIKKHYTAQTIIEVDQYKKWEKAISFCVIRNPWERLYSHYKFKRIKGKISPEFIDKSFEFWARSILNGNLITQNLQPQLDWICDVHNEVIVKHILNFKFLQTEFNEICKLIDPESHIDLPIVNKSIKQDDYRKQYNESFKLFVAEIYKRDIDYFEFGFEL